MTLFQGSGKIQSPPAALTVKSAEVCQVVLLFFFDPEINPVRP